MQEILREGSRGSEVRGAQQLLNERLRPMPRLTLDGQFGPKTRDAVRLYQHRQALLEDGEIGNDTWRALSGTQQRRPSPRRAHQVGSVQPLSRLTKVADPKSFSAEFAGPIAANLSQSAIAPPKPLPLSHAGAIDTMIAAHPDAPWMRVAAAELGIHERSAFGTPRILQYHAATALYARSDQVAWCASFVNWCLSQVGLRGTNSAAAASFADWGTSCPPRFGAIIQLHHGVAGHDRRTGSSSGNHVAFFLSMNTTHVELLGGNQSDSVKVSRFPIARYKVVACRWPR